MKRKLTLAFIVLAVALSWTDSCAAEHAPSSAKEVPAMTKDDLFQKIEALTKLEEFTPKSVSKALGMPLEFDDLSPESTHSEAHGQPGAAIESVELRGNGLRFLTFSVSRGTGVTKEDIRRRFGEAARIGKPVSHRPSKGPLYLIYVLPGQELKFAVSLEKPNTLLEVILDRTDSALNEIKANASKEKR